MANAKCQIEDKRLFINFYLEENAPKQLQWINIFKIICFINQFWKVISVKEGYFCFRNTICIWHIAFGPRAGWWMGLARFVFSWLLAILHSPRCSLWICWSFCPRTLPLTLSFDLLNCLSCLLGSFLDPQEGLGAFLQALKDICFPLSLPGRPKIVWPCLLLLTSLWYRKFLYYYIPSTQLVPGIASG